MTRRPAERINALTSKAQKELGKALEALRTSKPAEARNHLDAAYRSAPDHPEVNYYLGVYWSQMNDWMQAKSYWTKTIDVYSKHLLCAAVPCPGPPARKQGKRSTAILETVR